MTNRAHVLLWTDNTTTYLDAIKAAGLADRVAIDTLPRKEKPSADQLARTEALIAQKLIRAPFSGVLGVQRVHEGQYVKQGEALVTLTDLHTLFLNLTLPEQTHAQLALGQVVES